MGREVITIQAGGFANHVAAHYWNIQVILLLTLASSYLANGDMGVLPYGACSPSTRRA